MRDATRSLRARGSAPGRSSLRAHRCTEGCGAPTAFRSPGRAGEVLPHLVFPTLRAYWVWGPRPRPSARPGSALPSGCPQCRHSTEGAVTPGPGRRGVPASSPLSSPAALGALRAAHSKKLQETPPSFPGGATRLAPLYPSRGSPPPRPPSAASPPHPHPGFCTTPPCGGRPSFLHPGLGHRSSPVAVRTPPSSRLGLWDSPASRSAPSELRLRGSPTSGHWPSAPGLGFLDIPTLDGPPGSAFGAPPKSRS